MTEIEINEAEYAKIRNLCEGRYAPVEVLLLAHSLAQYYSCATIDELDGYFLEKARLTAPRDLRVFYALLDKQPNIDGNPNQRDFEIKVVDQFLKWYPDNLIALEAKAILDATNESLPVEFINKIPDCLTGIKFDYFITLLREGKIGTNTFDDTFLRFRNSIFKNRD